MVLRHGMPQRPGPTYERVVHTLAGMFEQHVEHDVEQRSIEGTNKCGVCRLTLPPPECCHFGLNRTTAEERATSRHTNWMSTV